MDVTYDKKRNIHPVFVYGTLMKGQRAEHMLAGSDFAGNFQLKGYAMYHLGFTLWIELPRKK